MDLFQSIDDIGIYAQGVERSIDISDLEASFLQARHAVALCIGDNMYDLIKINDNHLFDRAQEKLKYALANYTMYKYLMFWAISKNNTGQKLYKYQYEAIKEEYINVYWTAMDDLLTLLDGMNDEKWQESHYYLSRQRLLIKSADEFDKYLQIDRSAYFYSKVIFLIEKVMEDSILPRISQISDELRRKIDVKIKRALCYHVMAEAVQLFDLTELPKSFRNDIAHEFSKDGSMIQVREKLHQHLMSEADKYYCSIEETIANAVSVNGSAIAYANNNDERNKFYFGC